MRFDWRPDRLAVFNSSREIAARLNVLGALVLVTAAAAASILFFLSTLRSLAQKDKAVLLGAFAFTALLLGAKLLPVPQTDSFITSSLVCTSVSYSAEESKTAHQIIKEGKPTEVELPPKRLDTKCTDDQLKPVRLFETIDMFAVLLGLLSLVLGAIRCLAAPTTGSEAEKLAFYESASERLNGFLYLAALLLVTGLIFVAAMLRWPTHVLLEPDASAYEAHVNALTGYYGISYSVVIAAFYIPVAAILAERVNELKAGQGTRATLPDAFKGPLQILKIAAALFSTTLAGVLSSLLSLNG
jgi:hypothetical protein